MSLTDPYATVQDYKRRVDSQSAKNDFELEAQLLASSRMIDVACGTYFNQDDSVVERIYDGAYEMPVRSYLINSVEFTVPGTFTRLYIPDDISTTTGLVVKVDLDEDFVHETTLVLNTDFWVGPWNANTGPEPRPYNFLEVVPNNSTLNSWPAHERSVSITAKFGWPTVPYPIKEATILLTREIVDMQKSGFTLAVSELEQAMRLSPRIPNILSTIIKQYGRSRRFFA